MAEPFSTARGELPESLSHSRTQSLVDRTFRHPVALLLGSIVLLTVVFERFMIGDELLAFGDLQPFVVSISIANLQLHNYWILASTGYSGAPLPYVLLEGFASQALGNSGLAEHLYVLGLLPAAAVGMYVLMRTLTEKVEWRVGLALLYGFNPVSLTLVSIGSIPDNCTAYALMPWLILLGILATTRKSNWLLPALCLAMLMSVGLYWNPQILFWVIPLIPAVLFWHSEPAFQTRVRLLTRAGRLALGAGIVLALSLTLIYGGLAYLENFFVAHASSASTQLIGPTAQDYALDLTDNFTGQLPIIYGLFVIGAAGVLLLQSSPISRTGRDRLLESVLVSAVPVGLVGLWLLISAYGAPVWIAKYALFLGAYEPVSQIGLDVFCLIVSLGIVGPYLSEANASVQPFISLRVLARGVLRKTELGPDGLAAEVVPGAPSSRLRKSTPPTRRATRPIILISIVLVTAGLLFVPVQVGYENWPTMAGLAVDAPSLVGSAQPASLSEASGWLQSHPAAYAGERVAYLPVDPQEASFVAVLPLTYGYVTYYTPAEWNEIFAGILNSSSPEYRDLASLLGELSIGYVVLLNSSPSDSFAQSHSGPARYTPFGWPWQLEYFPSGNASAWGRLLGLQSGLTVVYSSPETSIYQVSPAPEPVSVYNLSGINATFSLTNVQSVAPNTCIPCLPAPFQGPLFLGSSNAVSNSNFTNGLSDWRSTAGNWTPDSTLTQGGAKSVTGPEQYAILEQKVDLTGGLWLFSGWIQAFQAGDSREDVFEFTSNGTFVGHLGPETGINGNTVWAYFGGLFDVPANVSYVVVELVAESTANLNATTWFSNIAIQPIEAPTKIPAAVHASAVGPAYEVNIDTGGPTLVLLAESYDPGWTCGGCSSGTHVDYDNGLFSENAFNISGPGQNVSLVIAYGPSTLQSRLADGTGLAWTFFAAVTAIVAVAPRIRAGIKCRVVQRES